MKISIFIIIIFCLSNVFGQENNNAEKLIGTEKTFAKVAEEKGLKPAFLEFLADDGIIFRPAAVNGKESWNSRPDSPALLSWSPVYADVSSNGILGYTTGAGEYRPNGKTDTMVYYSEYATVWRRQADGNYKAVLDIGISHDKPSSCDTNWTSPKNAEKIADENKPFASNSINLFFDTATTKGLGKAYKMFAADDARFLRDGKFPIIGKNNAPSEIKKSKITFGKSATIQSAGDLAYAVTTYEMKDGDKTIEKGNFVQVWKLVGGKWQIVLDVFAPIPLEKK
ncbi:MAG: DUF4440 domain-containing protein [Pyrinomonadaceae bacterium]